jgi:RNA polymerase sigma-70 factor (ECF subfamily)
VSAIDPALVIREHAHFVWRVLRHLGVDSDQLDDLSQEVFLVVLRQLPSFEGRSSPRTWIYGICRNIAQRARARASDLGASGDSALPEPSEPASQDHELWLKQAHACLVRALDTLDSDQRAVFLLYEIEELPMEEIATALAAPVTTCYSRLSAARRKVEAALRRREHVALQMIKGGAR